MVGDDAGGGGGAAKAAARGLRHALERAKSRGSLRVGGGGDGARGGAAAARRAKSSGELRGMGAVREEDEGGDGEKGGEGAGVGRAREERKDSAATAGTAEGEEEWRRAVARRKSFIRGVFRR